MEKGDFGEEVLSMVDVLQEDNELEEEANAVLGDSDDQHCTYTKGYVNRQALYACGTCTSPTSQPAGVCLACSLTCHEDHELYELYTKRHFRCDCGNSKFSSDFKCKLYPDKDAINKDNSYNQNFTGVYCTCHRPYPDPEDEIEDEMIQCVICEDWYHSRHLGCLPPAGGDFQEMICDACMASCSFLQAYLQLAVPSQLSTRGPSQQVVTKEESDVKVDVVSHKEKDDNSVVCEEDKKAEEQDKNENPSTEPENVPQSSNTHTTKVDNYQPLLSKSDNKLGPTKETENAQVEVPPPDCKLVQLQACVTGIKDGSSYWNIGWRSQLCKCTSCTEMYSSLGVSYLTNEQDTMVAYEERGKAAQAARLSSYESGMQALGGMGRINQVEAIHEYNDMKNELTEYLREFATQGKIVKPEDITSFFESMQSRKRQRTGSANTIQYSCK